MHIHWTVGSTAGVVDRAPLEPAADAPGICAPESACSACVITQSLRSLTTAPSHRGAGTQAWSVSFGISPGAQRECVQFADINMTSTLNAYRVNGTCFHEDQPADRLIARLQGKVARKV